MIKDDLGTRMKEFYEGIPKTKLMRRTPVAIRIDGKAFHTFTRGFKKPFDDILIQAMTDTTEYLCKNIRNESLAEALKAWQNDINEYRQKSLEELKAEREKINKEIEKYQMEKIV